MQRLGGDLTFDSQPGKGATFLVRIPKVLAE
jgi:signal transduction histidine kinase